MKKFILFITLSLLSSNYAEANWIQRADMGGGARHRGTACSIGNKGYIGLGHYNGTGVNIVLKDWWEFDPATNAWSQKADYIGPNPDGNYGVLTLGIGEFAYITGGAFSDQNVHRYDPKNNEWTTVGTAPVQFSNLEGFSVNGKGYAVQGNTLHEFDPATAAWTTKSPTPFGSSVWMGAMATSEKGYVRTSGGFYEYKPLTDEWISRAPFPGIATGASMNFTQRGKLYVVTGYGGGLSNVTSEVWEFDPFLNTWTLFDEFPGTSRRFGVAFSIGDRSYCGTGTNGTNFADFWEFDAEMFLSTDYLSLDKVKLYPNPAVDFLTIELDGYEQFDVTLTNDIGQIVRQLKTHSGEIRIEREALLPGQYFARIDIKGHYLGTKKIIFQ